MNWILGRSRLCAAGAALLVFASILVGASTPSAASPYTLAYTGTVTYADGAFQVLGAVAGDSVSGTLTINPVNESPTSADSTTSTFNQSSIAFTFHLTHSNSLDLNLAKTGGGAVTSLGFPGLDVTFFQVTDPSYDLALAFGSNGSVAPLASLAGLPNSSSALVAILGGDAPVAQGNFNLTGLGSLSFNIALAATPIPATLPLFISALGGLGFMTWRRRKADMDTRALSA
jgi:hypothetical protein